MEDNMNSTIPEGTESPAPNTTELAPKPPAKSKKWLLIAGVIVLIGGGVAAFFMLNRSQNPTPKVLKIGFISPQTGENASDGLNMKRGLELAQKDFNVEGVTIEIITKDTLCEAEPTAAAVKDLIENDKVVAIIGEDCSAATLAAAPIAESNHVVLISPSSTNPDITKAGDYIFRTIPSDALQAVFVAKMIHEAGYSRLGILYSNEAYGVGLGAAAKTSFEELGGKVVANEIVEREGVNFKDVLNRIKAASPDAVFMITNSVSSASATIIDAKAVGLTAKLYASEVYTDESIPVDAGSASEGLIVTTPAVKITEEFTSKFTTAFGSAPGGDSSRIYDTYAALAKVIGAGATTSDQIKDALYKLTLTGVAGEIKFDKNGDMVKGSYNVFVIKGGKFEAVKL